MSSDDKTCCGRPIKRRCEIRPVDAVFSSENRPDYLSTLWGGTHTQQRKQSLCLYFMLFIYVLLPDFRSAPHQLQSYDTYRWLLPLA